MPCVQTQMREYALLGLTLAFFFGGCLVEEEAEIVSLVTPRFNTGVGDTMLLPWFDGNVSTPVDWWERAVLPIVALELALSLRTLVFVLDPLVADLFSLVIPMLTLSPQGPGISSSEESSMLIMDDISKGQLFTLWITSSNQLT